MLQAKPKSVYKNDGPKSVAHNKFGGFYNSAAKFAKKKKVGVLFKDPVKVSSNPTNAPVHGKGKGKAIVFHTTPQYGCLSDSDDDSDHLAAPPILPSSTGFQAALIDYSFNEAGEGVGSVLAPPNANAIELSPIPLQVIYLGEVFQGNQFDPLIHMAEQNYGGFSMFESDVENDTMVLQDEDKSGGAILAHHETSFHSINSESSTVRHINALGVEQEPPMEPTSFSSAAKRRKGNGEDDSASSVLKRSKA